MTKSEIRSAPTPSASDEVSLGDVVEILRRRWIWILSVVGIGLLIGILLCLRPRKYEATSEIRIQPGTANMYRTSAASAMGGISADKIATEATILRSRTLYLRVAKELNLANDPDFWGTRHFKPRNLDEPLGRELVNKRMQAIVSVSRVPKEEILYISCKTVSPALSARIANSLVNDYVASMFQMRYGATQRASGWLIGQLDDLKNQIEADQKSLIDLQGKLGVLGSDTKGTTYLFEDSLSAIAKASSDATINRIIAEAKLKFLQESDPNLIEGEINLLSGPTNPEGGLLQSLRDSQAKLASNYTKLLAQTGPNFPEVKQARKQLAEITKQVDAEQARIINQAKISYNAAAANESMTNKALEQKKSQAFSSRDEMVKYMILLHDYEAHRTLYEGLVARLREAGITSGLEAGEIDIVDLADIPAIPVSPGPLILIAGALAGGLIFGIIVAFLVEAFDTSVKTQEQVEKATGLKLLAALPHHLSSAQDMANTAPTSPLIVDKAPKSRYAESLQALRTSLLLANPGVQPRVFLVTSSIPGEGKSTTSLNLAAILAQHHSRVLLIDCDLRRGTLAKRLGLNNQRGLSNILANQMTLEEGIQPIPGNEFLFFLADGPRPPDPAVLMGSEAFENLIKQCRERFDYIVLDSTPGLGLSDAINTARLADAVLLVVRQSHSNRKAVKEVARVLEAARLPVFGFTLNDVSAESRRYGYGYGSYYEEAPGEGKKYEAL